MNITKKNIKVLIPDGESHLLLEVATCLAEVKGLKIYVMSDTKDSPMKYSRLIQHFSFFEYSGSVNEWLMHIDEEVEKWGIDIIMPIFEIGIKRLIENQSLLKSKEKLMSWPSLKYYETAMDKWQLYNHLSSHEIPCPKTFLMDGNSLEHNIFPFVVKPTKGFGGGMEVGLIKNTTEYQNFKTKIEGSKTVYIAQDYIIGGDYCCNVLCSQGEIICYTIQKGIMWGANRFGAQIGHEFIYEDKILELSARLMKSLSWSGVACIDIKFDERENVYKIIEVNTRYWRSILGSLSAGVNFPQWAVYSHFRIPFNAISYQEKIYLNLKGLIKYLKKNIFRIFRFGFLWQNTALKYALLDPIPMIYKLYSRNW